MNNPKSKPTNPEIASYTKYYEHDGLLRAYANRAWLAAILFGVIALGSFAFAAYVRMQPPTVIRVDKDGNATVVGGARMLPPHFPSAFSAGDAKAAAPTDLEGKALVRRFLDDYLIYTPDSVDQNFSAALNVMTANLRTYTLNKLRTQDIVGKIQQDHIISDFRIRSIEHVKNTPGTYMVFGVNEVHRLMEGTETTDRIVGQYTVRLVETARSDMNPSGLLVGEFNAQEMMGQRDTSLDQQSAFDPGGGN
ncbi:MAG TPA: VirB8/TrbF family protein [Terriglobia bacterium]|nr:VirB8/TrbF family protein [Terriglobia bacterium]